MGQAKRRKQQEMAGSATAPTPRQMTLPERVVEQAAKGFDGFWKLADRVRANPDMFEGDLGPWSPWCFIPVNAVVGIASHILHDEYSTEDVELHMVGRTRLLSAAAAWRMTKGVYVFDTEVLKAIIDSEVDDDLPDELFLHLPEWCPYVSASGVEVLPGLAIHGFFAYVDDRGHGSKKHYPPELNFEILIDPAKSTDEDALATLAGMADPDVQEELVPIMREKKLEGEALRTMILELAHKREFLHMHANIPLGQGSFIRAYTQQAEETARVIPNARIKEAMEKNPQAFATVTEKLGILQARLGSLLLYLVSDRADISEGLSAERDRVVANERRGIRNFQAQGIHTWEVGYRIGAQIRDFQENRSGEGVGEGTGTSMRPHVRKAHWHSFWTGPRDKPDQRQIKVHWLPPIPVNVEASEDLVPTVHKVERELKH